MNAEKPPLLASSLKYGINIYLVLFAGICFFFRSAYLPHFDYDEFGIESLFNNFGRYGDWSYPIFLDAGGFNSDPIRKYPPILTGLLRGLLFGGLPLDADSSRVVSGVFILASVAALAGLLTQAFRRPILIGLGVLAICLSPAVITAARTVRFEQEIVFLGILGAVLPILAIGRGNGRWDRITWVVTGLATTWAGLSHPYGALFPVAVGLSLILYRRVWKEMDHMGFWGRGLWIAAGAALPVCVTAWSIFHDWPVYREFLRAFDPMYALRENAAVQFYKDRANGPWLFTWFGDRIGSKVYELGLYGLPRTFVSEMTGLLNILWYGTVIVALIGAVFLPWNVRDRSGVARSMFGLLLLTLCVVFLNYNVSTNYFAYFALLMPAGGVAVLCHAYDGMRSRVGQAVPGTILAVVGGIFATHGALYTKSLVETPITRPSVQGIIDMVARTGERLGTTTRPETYCDIASWPACGRTIRSAMQVTPLGLSGPPNDADAFILLTPLWERLLDVYPSMTDPRLPLTEKVERFKASLKGLKLGGIFDSPIGAFYYYVRPEATPGLLWATWTEESGFRVQQANVGVCDGTPPDRDGQYLLIARKDGAEVAQQLPWSWRVFRFSESYATVRLDPKQVAEVCDRFSGGVDVYRIGAGT